LYLEDTGKWCYDPAARTFIADGARNAAAFARQLQAVNPVLADRWCYRDAGGKTYGLPWEDVVKFCRRADLFLNVSASCWLRAEHEIGGRTALIDSDPLYTQAALQTGTDREVCERWRWWSEHFDVFFTFGENIGSADCAVPTGPCRWLPTRQPVVLDCFRGAAVPVGQRRRVLTTVASWEPAEQGPVVAGTSYAGKSREWERFLDLPSRSVLPLEIAMSGPAPHEGLSAHGWRLRDGFEVSSGAATYRSYLAHSLGEWSVAKNAYVASRSGWFSCRSACYLALGVPVIVQDTGFSKWLPSGKGLLTFSTLAEASAAIARVADNPKEHVEAARAVAVEFFDSDKVLGRLVSAALA
jgi:hypothetical protein